MDGFKNILSGGDLRSIGKSNSVVGEVRKQQDFDKLFKLLFDPDRLLVLRAADAIEKITRVNPQYLAKYKNEIIALFRIAKNIELQWHLALLIPRLHLKGKDFYNVWDILVNQALDKKNSRIVRVNAIQALFEMMQQERSKERGFSLILVQLKKENIPSINARIGILMKLMISRKQESN